jgi:hypothetical protein
LFTTEDIMSSRFVFGPVTLASLLALGATACSFNAPGAGGGSDPGTPVKQQPLAGTIDGQSFAARVALASPGFDGTDSRSVTIYTVAATCDSQPQPGDGSLQILVDVSSWTSGSAYELDLSHSVTFVEQKNGTPDNLIVDTGRLEVTDPGSAMQNGTLSLRATSSDFGSVEGQEPVILCSR